MKGNERWKLKKRSSCIQNKQNNIGIEMSNFICERIGQVRSVNASISHFVFDIFICDLNEVPGFECLLGLKVTPATKGNASLRSIAKDAGKLVGWLCRSRKYLSPDIFYDYTSQTRPKNGVLLPYKCWSYPTLTFQLWQSFEAAFWEMTFFFLSRTSFPPDAASQAGHCFFTISVANVPTSS